MENTDNKTWKDFKDDANKELEDKESPFILVDRFFYMVLVIVVIAFLISLPVLIYNNKFSTNINNTILCNSTNEVNVDSPINIDDKDTNNYNNQHNFTIINQINIPENISCNCSI